MTQDDVLQALLRELVALANQANDCFALADPDYADMVHVGIRYCPDRWHGKPLSSAQRMASSRAVRALANARLIERVTEALRDRVRHVRPTVAGLRRAIRLATDIDRADVLAGLRLTTWGTELADQLTPTRVPGTVLPADVDNGSASVA